MGLDQYFLEAKDERVYDSSSKSYINLVMGEHEIARWRKNYPLMDWLEKNLEVPIEDCSYYILTEDLVKKLYFECNEVIKTFYENGHKMIPEVRNKFKKYFPQNKWNKTDTYYDKKMDKLVTKKHVIDENDVYHLETIVDNISLHIKYLNKVLFYSSW